MGSGLSRGIVADWDGRRGRRGRGSEGRGSLYRRCRRGRGYRVLSRGSAVFMKLM